MRSKPPTINKEPFFLPLKGSRIHHGHDDLLPSYAFAPNLHVATWNLGDTLREFDLVLK